MNGLETQLHSCHGILLFSFKEEHISDPQSSLGAFVLSHFSRVRLFATPWTVARQAPLSMEFSRQEYWSGLPFPTPSLPLEALFFTEMLVQHFFFLFLFENSQNLVMIDCISWLCNSYSYLLYQ